MTQRLFPLIAPLWCLDRNTSRLIQLGDNLTHPQRRILDTVETVMVGGGEVRVVGGKRDFPRPAPIRLIILKARQMGVSTLVEAITFATSMVRPHSRSLIVSHDLDSSRHLLDMTRRYWETSWIAERGIYTPKNLSGNLLSWHEPDTAIRVTTAKNLAGGRSHTIHNLHASEVAFWEHAGELMDGLNQAIPRAPLTFQFLESTANGFGNYFKQTWDAAVAGDNSYLPIFEPWWRHGMYTADHIGIGHLADRPLTNLSDEEKRLARAFARIGLDDRDVRSKLLWRREILNTECKGDIDIFHQEYPATPEEAFVSTGRNVFNPKHLMAAYEPMDGERGQLFEKSGRVEFVPDRDGDLTIFRHPRPSGWYMVGADAAKQAKGDFAAAEVQDRITWEQVAEFRADIDPNTFADQIMLLGRYYNDAMLIPETNMSGHSVVAEIVRSRYPNVYVHQSDHKVRGQMAGEYGFNTNERTKPEAVGHVKRALLEKFNGAHGMTIHSRVLYKEMAGYIFTDTGKYQNSSSEEEADHDDTTMAWCLATTGTIHRADDPDRPYPSRVPHRRDDDDPHVRQVAATLDATTSARVQVETDPPDPDAADDPDAQPTRRYLMPVGTPSAYDDYDEPLIDEGDPW